MSDQVQVKLPDGSIKEAPRGTPILQFISEQIGPGLAKAAVGAVVDGKELDLSRPLEQDTELKVITLRDPEGLEILRHSAAHILASAVKRLFPTAQVTIGPAIETGFFYDFAFERPFTPEDLERIEAEAQKIIDEGVAFEREEIDRDAAVALFREMGEAYKAEIIESIPAGETLTLYKHGDFVDLCRGPHLPRTDKVGAFKILSSSGAYWRGDERNEMLQRIYGTAFADKKALKAFLHRLEEAKKRDHRRIGKDLDLFSVSEDVGGGLILWHPKGAMIRKIVEDFWRDQHLKAGYELVYSPHVGRAGLWQTSGHLDFYKESMYPEMEMEGQSFYAKPMNCPFHMTIYKTHMRSYRELPMRYAELGTVYRFERSGTLHGLMRVRGFTQDDAHLFVRPDQLEEQVVETVKFSLDMLRTFGFTEFEAYVSTRPEDAVGEPERWDVATQALLVAAERAGLKPSIDAGGGAFYGPKIDLKLKDAIGRTWQCSTIQFDFNLPERFKLEYVGEDNHPHQPYVIHRALLGSIERFFGILIEHYAGAFPMWLAPVQVGIVTIADRHLEFADEIARALRAKGLRPEVDHTSDKMGAKIRRFAMQKLPYVLVVGDKEVEQGGASVRRRGGTDEGFLPLTQLVERFSAESAMPELGHSPEDPTLVEAGAA